MAKNIKDTLLNLASEDNTNQSDPKFNIEQSNSKESDAIELDDRDGIESNLIFERYLCPSCLEYEMNIYRTRKTLYLCECQNCGAITVGLELNEILEDLKIIE
ncbi:hypothetical protein ACG95P_04120 [Acinetobacter guillouiae]|uniref:hypothetical protein n=1 Tax=Acinetobacter guillouiae TaxID=106649 RepID=UPI003AF4BBC6